jgi:uncharacterized membrane protein
VAGDEAPVMKRFSTDTERLEAFSDGVLAVIITIMVLDLRAPHEPTIGALGGSAPTFLAYILSFVFVGIYWNNHHHMLRASEGIDVGEPALAVLAVARPVHHFVARR